MSKRTKLVIIGFGNIAKEHIKACLINNYEIAFIIRKTKKGYYRNIPIFTWQTFPGFDENIKAIICATDSKVSRFLINHRIPENIPTLYEKPLFEDIESFEIFLRFFISNKNSIT